uniref:Protein Dok-7-like n=1 Tax=Diabrotica virgifera virgifera TaxID=50390 RepID=A0A6P7GQU0_DIAVI
MVDNSCVIEGTVKFRDGKKWKSRWCVMRKLSPVAGMYLSCNVTGKFHSLLFLLKLKGVYFLPNFTSLLHK